MTGSTCSSRSRTPDLGNGGLGRLAACFHRIRWPRCNSRRWATACDTSTASSGRSIQDGWQHEQPDNWLRRPDPWEVARPDEKVEIKLNCSFEVRGGSLRAVPGRPSTLIGIPFDRPVVGYGGKTINTLRLWAAAAPDYFDFQEFSSGDFVGALGRDAVRRIADPGALSGRLHEHGAGPALRAGVLSGRLLAGRSRAPIPARQLRLERCFPRRPPSS